MKEINLFIYAQFIGIPEKLDSGHIPGRLNSGRLDAWNLARGLDSKRWTLDNWTLRLSTPGRLDHGRLDSGRLDAWTLDPWTQKILSILVTSFLLLFRHII